ncbi:MAG: hypothetical protein E6845_18570 [Clostridium sp.]|uniref:hypothetical protein n=1 Tax=Clostridium sp. TaxID=1506 RepID=UPI0029005965|nr:hypothetical protein [Clostridium sp.]MDU1604963.1 hypothetical protein [Clostridium sp.]
MESNKFFTSLEKAIYEAIKKYEKKLNFKKNYVSEGKISILNAAYGINSDNDINCWCFRSAQNDEIYNYMSQNYKFKNADKISDVLSDMMEGIRDAVNNSDNNSNIFKSYSKCLTAPLFKYNNGNTPLFINKLHINSLDIEIEVDCFNWFGEGNLSYDTNGNEMDRYHGAYFNETISFKELTSKEKLFKRIWDLIDGEFGDLVEYMDVDNVSATINGITIDISQIDRDCFDRYFDDEWETKFKRYASYKKDKEVITTKGFSGIHGWCIRNPIVLQFLRYVYILKINWCYTEDVEEFVCRTLENKYTDKIQFDEEDKRAFNIFLEYLNDDSVLDKERSNYENTFNCTKGETKWMIFYKRDIHRMRSDVIDLLERLYIGGCFENDFFEWIKFITKDLWGV